MAESRLITDPFEADWWYLWSMIELCCESERHQSATPGASTTAEQMAKEIHGFDQEGGPEYAARVKAVALAYGEEEIQALEEALADTRAAVELLRRPRANPTRTALYVLSSDA